MGKVFQLLNGGEIARRPSAVEPAGAEAVGATPPESEGLDEEVPFIEVGPHHSLEASPSVLAAAPWAPKGTPEAPAVSAHPAPPADRPPAGGVWRPATPPLVFHGPDDPAAACYRHVLARLTRARAAAPVRLVLFLPAAPALEELTVAVLLNLAVTAARGGERPVVVVDADRRRPRVARALGLAECPGLGEVLAGEVGLEQALRPTEPANLLALTAGGDERPGGVRLVSETVRSVLRQLRQRYDLVFVRGPAWDGGPDARHLAEICDAAYPVLPEADAAGSRLDELLQALPRQGAVPTGCLLVS